MPDRAEKREYMRLWRQAHPDRVRYWNKQAQLKPGRNRARCFFCPHAPKTIIERIDVKSGAVIQVPYCGNC
jgi:hypothetical protein